MSIAVFKRTAEEVAAALDGFLEALAFVYHRDENWATVALAQPEGRRE